MSSKGKRAPVLPPSLIPTPLEPDIVEVNFQLKGCPFNDFKKRFDRSVATVYDLMFAVSKQHGNTVLPEDVQIFIPTGIPGQEKEVTDFNQSLGEFPDISKIIYNFNPISGSLLTIPTENMQK